MLIISDLLIMKLILKGHMGHGHSHGGHGHSHGGHSHSHGGGHSDSHGRHSDSHGKHSENHGRNNDSDGGHSNSHGGNSSNREDSTIEKGLGNNNGKNCQNRFESAPTECSGQEDLEGQKQEMSVNLQERVKGKDNRARHVSEKDSELRTIVIVNKVVARDDEVDGTIEDSENGVSQGEVLGSLAESRVHLTPSRYKMGIMLAAIQANENVGQENAEETNSKHLFILKYPYLNIS